MTQRDIEQYLSYMSDEKGASKNTIGAYGNDLSQLYQHLCSSQQVGDEDFKWRDVRKAQLGAFFESPKVRTYAVTTFSRKMAVAKSFYHWLKARRLVKFDLGLSLDLPRIEKTVPRTLSPEEAIRLLETPSTKPSSPEVVRDSAMLRLIYATGMGVTEMVSLDIDDIDLETDYVRVLGKNGQRYIPFDAETHEALLKYMQESRPVLVRQGETTILFLNHRGETLTRQGVWLIFNGYVKAAGIEGSVSPGTLRNSFGKLLFKNKVDARDVQVLMGYANIETAKKYLKAA